MFVRLGHLLLIVALLAATGGHWALLQTVAWTTMLANNLQTDSLTEALTRTFDGNHPCKMCHAISEGKKSEKQPDLPRVAKKLEFTCERGALVFSTPIEFYLMAGFDVNCQQVSHRPPVPPPRGLAS